FEGTIEFYPEEGKYHMDGHRDCKVCMDPPETKKNDFKCTKCKKRVTVGVMHRIDELAEPDRPQGYKPKNPRPFHSIIPLPEIVSEIESVGVQSKRVKEKHMELLSTLGNEFSILLDIPIADIESHAGPVLAEAIKRMREGRINVSPGYDGEYGKITVFKNGEKETIVPQEKLF
ncbi:MAG: hypothetical protein ABH833_00040, partial [Parcubacteria group bacterium]